MSSQNVGTDVLRTLHRIHRQLTDLKGRLERGPKQIRAGEASVEFREELADPSKKRYARLSKAEAKNIGEIELFS